MMILLILKLKFSFNLFQRTFIKLCQFLLSDRALLLKVWFQKDFFLITMQIFYAIAQCFCVVIYFLFLIQFFQNYLFWFKHQFRIFAMLLASSIPLWCVPSSGISKMSNAPFIPTFRFKPLTSENSVFTLIWFWDKG